MNLIEISRELSDKLGELSFSPPVTHVYNPLEYARAPWETYLRRFGEPGKEAIFLGMNPGPFGMAQTGVPFGDVGMVRDWLGINEPVGKPPEEHPKRIIEGFDCARSEVSGSRLWGWAKERFPTPEPFFERFFVANFCPLVFMEQSGKNFTPDKLPTAEKTPLFSACDEALRRSVEVLRPKYAVGVGVFAEQRLKEALKGLDVAIGRILHPSPASPAANRGWAEQATKQLAALGIDF